MIKYIKMIVLFNFGNMFLVFVVFVLLFFLLMMSVYFIFLNLIYDLFCIVIFWDNVDEEFIIKFCKWDVFSVGSFMIWIGLISFIFDFIIYIFMYFVFCLLFVLNGVLFNDLFVYFSGVELVMF